MPERSFSVTHGYRYGFNGKENDSDVKGIEGSQQDYGMRIYDPRLARFLSFDPLAYDYPWNSPYAFAENRPIDGVDLDGEEFLSKIFKAGGKAAVQKVTKEFVEKEIKGRLKEYSSKNFAKQFAKDAEGALEIMDDAWWEHAISAIPFGVGDVYDVASFFYKLDKMWDKLKGIQKWAERAKTAASHSLKKFARFAGLKGQGLDKLNERIEKINNQADHLTEDDLGGAVREIMGDPKGIKGTVYQHLDEVNKAIKGLGNEINNLDKLINDKRRQLTGEVLEKAKEIRASLQKQKDNITEALTKAKNEAIKEASD